MIVTHCCKYCYSIYVYRSGTSLCLAMLGRSSSPSAAWLRWITRADCCFSSSVQFTADAQASSQFSSSSGLCQRAHSGFCRPNFAAFDCFEQRSLPGSRAACVGVSHADVPAVFLYLYCFSQPFSFACKNSCAIKPRSSSALRHRYSFCVLLCYLPWASSGRMVSIIWAGDYDITHHTVETVVRKFVQKR